VILLSFDKVQAPWGATLTSLLLSNPLAPIIIRQIRNPNIEIPSKSEITNMKHPKQENVKRKELFHHELHEFIEFLSRSVRNLLPRSSDKKP
jgi:hypothetical protein